MHQESLLTNDNQLTWKTLRTAINTLPDLTTWLNISSDDLSPRQIENISRRRSFFRKLVEKVVGMNKDEQVAFLISEARKINQKTYVQAALSSIPKPPDYSSLDRSHRQQYNHVHKLIDLVLPIAAGSESLSSQRQVFENRWQYYHHQPYGATKFQDIIKEVTNPADLWKISELAIQTIPSTHDESKENESNEQEFSQDRRCKTLMTLIDKIFDSEMEFLRFYTDSVKSIDRKKCVRTFLDDMKVPPEYISLSKKDKRKYVDVHSLIDLIIPIAAGSTSLDVQLLLVEAR